MITQVRNWPYEARQPQQRHTAKQHRKQFQMVVRIKIWKGIANNAVQDDSEREEKRMMAAGKGKWKVI